MGCNTFSYQYMAKTESISFYKGILTQMICDEMQLEYDFCSDLQNITHYKIDGHFLHLLVGKTSVMKFIAEDWD